MSPADKACSDEMRNRGDAGLTKNRIVAAAGFLLGLAALPAGAVEPEAPPALAALLAPSPNARACYSRAYDKAHLAAHPKQKVADIALRLTWRVIEGECEDCSQGYLFQMQLRRRADKKPLVASGPCMERDGKAFCGVECDGGGVFLEKRGDGSLLVAFGDSWGIRMSPDCGEEDEVAIEPGADDKAFRLDPLPAAQCPPYDKW
jgi:hypothetical protein